jgi:hypothetical protein
LEDGLHGLDLKTRGLIMVFNGLEDGLHGLDHCFSWTGSLFFMDDRMDSEGFFKVGFGVFPFFQRSASILSKNQVPLCNLKTRLF